VLTDAALNRNGTPTSNEMDNEQSQKSVSCDDETGKLPKFPSVEQQRSDSSEHVASVESKPCQSCRTSLSRV
jgi:hypothetical protein